MIVAEVRDSAGQPVNGVPVEFSVEPDWQKSIRFTPQRPVTENNGEALSLVVPTTTGIVHITARAGDRAMTARITVSGAGSTGQGRSPRTPLLSPRQRAKVDEEGSRRGPRGPYESTAAGRLAYGWRRWQRRA